MRSSRALHLTIAAAPLIETQTFAPRLAAFTMRGMDTINKPREIVLGPVTLRQTSDGRLLAGHKALAQPAVIDAMQLQRWLLRQLREQVAA